MREYTVTKNGDGSRADRFLSKTAPDVPPSALQKAFRRRDVKRGGKPCRAGERLAEGDTIRLYGVTPPVGNGPPARSAPPGRERIGHALIGRSLNILYEDPHILVLRKPAGLPSQNDGGEAGIEDMARAYLRGKGEWAPAEENGFLPSLCHRLDRNTEGLLLFAKTAAALRVLTEKIKNREIIKTYRCVIEGVPPEPSGEWRDWLWKDAKRKRVYAQMNPSPGAKQAVLRYRVLRTRGERSLLEIELVTGRTHQIRVQCASRGFPIAGDGKYGRGGGKREMALCAVKIEMRFRADAGALGYMDGQVFQIDKNFADFIDIGE
ncbi:MAG: RluA family pseudouridine synthase [Oscillospiraceae bacterium]|jgi:23S rRNA pseudouridine955/2504/2580 synthase|nr:RluA family pseudouridine synthase [Oscillospiraceae bacterium]